jgi:hypothetical protein
MQNELQRWEGVETLRKEYTGCNKYPLHLKGA